MDNKTQELIYCLDKIVPLLKKERDPHWSIFLTESSNLLKSSDFAGITKLLSAFGGKGTFSDPLVSPEAEKLKCRILVLAEAIKQKVQAG